MNENQSDLSIVLDTLHLKAKVNDNVTINFALVTFCSGEPCLKVEFYGTEYLQYSDKDWIEIHKFITEKKDSMMLFAYKKRQEVLRKAEERENSYRKEKTKDTYPGYVYLLLSDIGYYKIGQSKNVDKRILQLETSLPVKLEFVSAIKSNQCYKAEKKAQDIFRSRKVSGEWFSLSDDDVLKFKNIVDYSLD